MVLLGEYVFHLVFGVAGLWLSVIDAREHRLPNVGTAWTGLLFGSIALVLVGFGQAPPQRIAEALLASIFSTGFLLLLAVLPSKALGLGDVKLQSALGFYLGWLNPVLVLGQVILGFILGGMVAWVMVLARKMGPRDPLAFGPFMIAASAVMVWLGKSLEII
jgi:leader peptidase (prepilin peptidase)/N-methyltransferase